MENEIKANEYARSVFGKLYVVLNKYERGQFGEICVQLGDFYTKEFEGEEWEHHLKIGKLIDLIQCGDYVNGTFINYISDTDIEKEIWHDANDMYDAKCFREKDIKTIVTKEMMESISYKVETH